MATRNQATPNALAAKIKSALLSQFPEWATFVEIDEEGDIEIAVPASMESKAGHLVVTTQNGKDVWIRFSPPCMAYSVDDEVELVDIVKQLLTEQASFVVIREDQRWAGTTLVRPNEIPELKAGQQAQIVSWLGTYDREVA